MNEEFLSLIKSLNVPLPGADDIAALNRLQKQWEHWENRERQHAVARIAQEQEVAFSTYLDNPSAENEQRLLITADEALTGKRYALLRRAFAILRIRVSAKAGEILRPVVKSISAALYAERERRLEAAEPVMSSKRRNPTVVEATKAVDYCDRLVHQVHTACAGEGSRLSPLQLADVLIGGADNLTPEAGQ
jgi:hypothetical protein